MDDFQKIEFQKSLQNHRVFQIFDVTLHNASPDIQSFQNCKPSLQSGGMPRKLRQQKEAEKEPDCLTIQKNHKP